MEMQLLAFLGFLEAEYHYSDNTIAAYKNDLTQFLAHFADKNPPLGSDLAHVTTEDIQAYVSYMNQQTYASSSVARKVAAIKSFFNYLSSRQFIASNPTARITSPKVKKRLPQTLTFEEVERLLMAPTDDVLPKNWRDIALLKTLYTTGMRVTEVVSLRQEDVDFERGVLHCPTKEEVRDLPIDAATAVDLHQYLQKGRPFLSKNKAENALFLNHRGQQLTRQGLWLIIKAYAKQAKLDQEVTPHTLRHSFAAHKLEKGGNLQDVQRLLGHANLSTTQVYTQLLDDHEDDYEEVKPVVTPKKPKITPEAIVTARHYLKPLLLETTLEAVA